MSLLKDVISLTMLLSSYTETSVQVGNEVKNTSEQSLEANKDLVQRDVDARKDGAKFRDGRRLAKESSKRIGDIL